MKSFIVILISFFLSFISCKNDNNIESNNETVLPKQKKDSLEEKNQKERSLTKVQLSEFFPEYIGSNKRFNIFLISGEALATATYGSFQNSYSYSIADCIEDNSVIKNFETSYTSNLEDGEGTEYIKKDRDGYKTIAFLQPKFNQYSIEFIYKNRFKILLEGPEHPDVMWSYINKEDLKKLDTY